MDYSHVVIKTHDKVENVFNPLNIEFVASKIVCRTCSNPLISEKHVDVCINQRGFGGCDIPLVNRLRSESKIVSWSTNVSLAIAKIKPSSNIEYDPNVGMTNLWINNSYKELCVDCDFYVVKEGHDKRCKKGGSRFLTDHEGNVKWSLAKKNAWIGDTLQRIDLQVAAIILEVPDKEKENYVIKYSNGIAQANYLRDHASSMGIDKLQSDGFLSTLFEANYSGKFRSVYLDRLLPAGAASIVLDLSSSLAVCDDVAIMIENKCNSQVSPVEIVQIAQSGSNREINMVREL